MAETQRVLNSVEALKALAHPLRQQMLHRLRQQGSATSAILAVEFGVDRGAASYHLRQLHRFGFIEDDAERSAGRRRFWRAVAQDLRLPPVSPDPEVNLAVDEIVGHWRGRAERSLTNFAAHRQEFGAFADAAMASYSDASLTAEELAQFTEEYIAFVQRWQRDPQAAPTDARHITILFYAFPTSEPSV